MPQSKFGGIPVEDNQPRSRFGGVAVDEPAPVSKPAELPAIAPQAPQTAERALTEGLGGLNPLPGLWNVVRHPLDSIRAATDARHALGPRSQEDFRKGHNVEGVGHWIESKIPFLGPAMAAASDQIGGVDAEYDKYGHVTKSGTAPDPVGGLARTLGTGAGVFAGPALMRGVGKGVQAAARPLVRSALQIPAKADAWGANPARFILENTSSVRPAGIADQSGKVIQGLNADQEAAAAASKTPAHLGPARGLVDFDIAKAASRNSATAPKELAPMRSFLREPQPGFTGATEYPPGASTPISFKPTSSPLVGPNGAPIAGAPKLIKGAAPALSVAEEQNPLTMLGMRRQLDQDFIRNWSPTTSTKGALGTARKVYHALGDETDRVIPGGAARDSLIQSGIGAKRAAEAASLRASLGQRILGRISRPTGGLVPAMIGLKTGGPLGGAAALTAAEAAASPVPLMVGARGAFLGGRAIGSPLSQAAMRSAPLLKTKRPEQE